MDAANFTISSLAGDFRAKKLSASEFTKSLLGKIKAENKTYANFLAVTEDLALSEAKAADENLRKNPEASLMTGIPGAFKDNILVADEICTAGSRILENYKAAYDSTVTARLKSAGAVILGKTNLDEFAMGSSTENSGFGPSRNPHDTSRVPGGSSGGSAVAVAADQCLFALGSDTGGSIRQPAAFCGVVGLKPTYGSVSRYGLIAMASSLDQIGPLVKTAEDAAIVFETISGRDANDSTSADFVFKTEDLNKFSLRGAKIGLPKEYFIEGLDKKTEERVRDAVRKFESAGATVREITLPHTKYALAVYYILVPSEISANLARYDGMRYGFSDQSADTLSQVYWASREKGLGAEPKRRVMLGTFTLSHGYYDAYYLKAQKVRMKIAHDFENAFKEVDLIVTPTAPTPAFKIGEKSEDPLAMYLSDVFTVPASLAGIPAVSVPAARTKGELPVGIQIIGRHFEEAKILSAVREFEKINS